MEWVMLWAFNFAIVQVQFETEALCEAAKAELVEEHGQKPSSISCVRVQA